MQNISGFFLVSKPKGITSHDVVDQLRKVTGERTIGHAGTLDPLATGLMLVAIGRDFTKQIQNFVGLDKEYIARVTLGSESTTYDSEGELRLVSNTVPTLEAVQEALRTLTGQYEQMPPQYSAKKIGGKKAYALARAGLEAALKPKLITVYEIEFLNYGYPEIQLRTRVSSGTYIRSLAHDLGERLLTGAYLSELTRTQIGEFELSRAIDLNDEQLALKLELSRVKL
jgi:tRNA pseudouridine55 synthase